jgi:hypothetical protein
MTGWRMTGWVNIRDGFTCISSPVLIGEESPAGQPTRNHQCGSSDDSRRIAE